MSDEKKQPEATAEDIERGDDAGAAQDAPDKAAQPPAEGLGEEAAVEPDEARESGDKSRHGTGGDRSDRARRHGKTDDAPHTEHTEAELTQLAQELEASRSEARDLKDKWLRSVAEFDNYRKRTRKEWDLLQQRTKAEVVLNILSVVDDFERACSVVEDRDDDFIRGIRLIYNKLAATLEDVGVRKIEAIGAAFDPTYHMAVAQIEREGAESNAVVEVVQEGYSLGDIVVRPAKVVIAK